MASSTLGFTLIHSLPSRTLWVTSGFLNHPFLKSHVSTVSSSSSNHINQLKLKQFPLPRASSSEEASSELIEDSKFVPLNADDPIYGPPALLLLGFEVEETVKQPNARKRNTKMQQLLKELDGEFLQVILCTEDMITSSLWEAMHTRQTHLETVKVAKSLPRICFLSGLSGEEMMMFIDAFPETGLESAVFAALVPNSADKPLQELIEEIMGDHEMMTANQSSST